jgi:hypothetical protein
MDIAALGEKFRAAPVEKAAEVLVELAASQEHDGRGNYLASTLVGEMEDWDELFEQPGIEEIY